VPYPPARFFLTTREVEEWKHAPPQHPLWDIVMVALTPGMRMGKIPDLKWDDVRLESRFIKLPNTKNNTSRVVPINGTLYRFLAEMQQKSGYVFGNGNGGQIGDIKHSFTSACKKAGITDFGFDDLRHTYASHLAMRGVHIRAYRNCWATKHWL